MTGGIRCLVEREYPVALVRVVGGLDLHSASELHGELLKVLADQPSAMIVDLSGMRVREPVGLTALAAVSLQASEWPAVPFLLCAASSATMKLLMRNPVCRDLTVETREVAMRRVKDPMSVPRVRVRLLPGKGAARRARDVVTEACAGWGLPALIAPASLIVSELVTNAIKHAGTPMTVTLAHRDRLLHVAVRDGSLTPPRMGNRPDPLETSGRGLFVVRSMARSMGSVQMPPHGKTVWATLVAEPRYASSTAATAAQ